MAREYNYLGKVVEYIKRNLKKGYTRDSLKFALINQGHSKIEIEKAFRQAEHELSKKAPVLKTKPQIKYELIEPKLDNIKLKKQPFWKKFF